MADPVQDVKNAVSDAKSAALNAVNKQEGWLEANKKPLLIGAGFLVLLLVAVYFLKHAL